MRPAVTHLSVFYKLSLARVESLFIKIAAVQQQTADESSERVDEEKSKCEQHDLS